LKFSMFNDQFSILNFGTDAFFPLPLN